MGREVDYLLSKLHFAVKWASDRHFTELLSTVDRLESSHSYYWNGDLRRRSRIGKVLQNVLLISLQRCILFFFHYSVVPGRLQERQSCNRRAYNWFWSHMAHDAYETVGDSEYCFAPGVRTRHYMQQHHSPGDGSLDLFPRNVLCPLQETKSECQSEIVLTNSYKKLTRAKMVLQNSQRVQQPCKFWWSVSLKMDQLVLVSLRPFLKNFLCQFLSFLALHVFQKYSTTCLLNVEISAIIEFFVFHVFDSYYTNSVVSRNLFPPCGMSPPTFQYVLLWALP